MNPDDVEVLYKTTVNDPIRVGFQSLKHVRDNHPTNFFQKKAGLLPE